MGRFLDILAKKRGQEDGSKIEREGEKKGKAVLKQANKDALASQKLQEALLAPSVKKSKAKKEAQEVVDQPPASEMGAPEFAEESVFSLLEANEFAEPADVNAFFELNLPPGTDMVQLSDTTFRELLGQKEDFSRFVARRIVHESVDSVLSRPVGPDSILERALAMHPKTKEHVKALADAARESERIGNQMMVLRRGLDQTDAVVRSLHAASLDDQVEAMNMVRARLEEKLTELELEKEENATLREQLEAQSKVGRDELEASYRAEMVALSERLGETLEKVAELSPAAIRRDAEGRLQLDIEKISSEGKKELSRLLEQAAAGVSLREIFPEYRQKELNLRILLEVDWMQDFTHQYLRAKDAEGRGYMSDSRYFDTGVPLIWSTMVDVLKTSSQEKQQDPAVLSKFLTTEGALFRKSGVTSLTSPRTHVPKFDQNMPSSLPMVIERAKSDDKLAKELFDSGGPLIEDRLRAVYPNHIWNSARDPVVADVQSIARNFGPRYRTDPSFQDLLSRVARAANHQTNTEQHEKLLQGIAPYVHAETGKILGEAIAESVYGERQMNRFRLYNERLTNPRFSRFVELLRKVDPENDLMRWINWQDNKISYEAYASGK